MHKPKENVMKFIERVT